MNPTRDMVKEDRALTGISVAYRNPEYVWDRVFPVVQTNGRESDFYFVYDPGNWFRNEARVVAPGDTTPVAGMILSKEPYVAEEYGVKQPLPERILKNQDPPLDLMASAAVYTADKVHLRLETNLANMIFRTGVWANDVDITATSTPWDAAGANIIGDIKAAFDAVRGTGAKRPNTLLVSPDVWEVIAEDASILDRIRYTQRAVLTKDLLAALLEIDRVLIGNTIVNTAPAGAEPVFANVWPEGVLAAYVAPTPGLMMPTAGYTFEAQPMRTRRYWDEDRKSWLVETYEISAFKVVGAGLGCFLHNILAG
ncbi:MAG: hypothetical protein PHZ19_11885 [Candidatus Thermoplasmatota archaeon]|nr:hypothetical protein [Candidatus Thermoplasmatota archaeon]